MYRKILCLQLLPDGKIEKVLMIYGPHLATLMIVLNVRKLFDYVEDTWISRDLWSPEAWSFQQEVAFTFISILNENNSNIYIPR